MKSQNIFEIQIPLSTSSFSFRLGDFFVSISIEKNNLVLRVSNKVSVFDEISKNTETEVRKVQEDKVREGKVIERKAAKFIIEGKRVFIKPKIKRGTILIPKPIAERGIVRAIRADNNTEISVVPNRGRYYVWYNNYGAIILELEKPFDGVEGGEGGVERVSTCCSVDGGGVDGNNGGGPSIFEVLDQL